MKSHIPKILIVGSTGELGTKLLKFCSKNKIKVNAITGYRQTFNFDRELIDYILDYMVLMYLIFLILVEE